MPPWPILLGTPSQTRTWLATPEYLGSFRRAFEALATTCSVNLRKQRSSTQPLQLRFALEQIVMGSLVTNRVAIEEITEALAKQNMDDARKLARKANPPRNDNPVGYWPTPFRVREDDVHEALPPDAGHLTEDRWPREWGRVSALLHAPNPYRRPLNVEKVHAELSTLQGALVTLMGRHVVLLAGGDYLVMGLVSEDDVHVRLAGRVPEPPTES
jgi:hypothetical protein